MRRGRVEQSGGPRVDGSTRFARDDSAKKQKSRNKITAGPSTCFCIDSSRQRWRDGHSEASLRMTEFSFW